jgi:hypothetical protein
MGGQAGNLVLVKVWLRDGGNGSTREVSIDLAELFLFLDLFFIFLNFILSPFDLIVPVWFISRLPSLLARLPCLPPSISICEAWPT